MCVETLIDCHGIRYYAARYHGRLLGVWSDKARAIREGLQMAWGNV